MAKQGYVAFDLGAESGRAMLAVLDGDRITLEEVHRFLNVPVKLPSGYHWNFTGLWANLVEGLGKCAKIAAERGVPLVSVGVDTWGVDFGLVGKSGQLLGLPYAYRDASHTPAMKKALAKVKAKAIYDTTGIQFMPLNSLFQLVARQKQEPKLLQQAHRLLFVPDLLHYFFSGVQVSEATIASTSQFVDPRKGKTGAWAKPLLRKLGLPTHFLPKIVPAGTKLGKLRKEIADDLGIKPIDVIAPATHDTASAVAAVPVSAELQKSGRWAYISSGTWSLMGAELNKPLISDASHKANYTNERGVAGTIRFLKNIAGLWLVQEVRRDLEKRGETYDYAKLTELAVAAPPFRTILDPDHASFLAPGDFLAKIDTFARKTRQPKPENVGQYVRACLESLALRYRQVLDGLEELLSYRVELLHIVGGGGRNALLNQMTADAIGRPVIVGPYEATAIGNALVQALGAGRVKDLAHLRAIVRNSFELTRFEPRNPGSLDEPLARLVKVQNARV